MNEEEIIIGKKYKFTSCLSPGWIGIGKVIKKIPAGELPTVSDIRLYYNINTINPEDDRIFNFIHRKNKYNRAVCQRDNGKYFIIPLGKFTTVTEI